MIPLDAEPALCRIARPYLDAGFRAAVGAHGDTEAVSRQMRRLAGGDAEAVEVGPTATIAATVEAVLDRLGWAPEALVVHFADTLAAPELDGGDAFLYAETEDTYRWTAFETGRDGRIERILAKNTVKPAGRLRVFVGVSGFADPERFRALLRRALAEARGPDDPFWTALAEYHNGLAPERARLVEASLWEDLGHLDTYWRARRERFLNRRRFNQLRLDAQRGVLRKSSTEAAKLAREVGWYIALPEPLRPLAPRVFRFEEGVRATSVELEYYGYPTLSDAFLFGRWDPGVWWQALGSIGGALDAMRRHRDSGGARQLREAMVEMYERKTLERLERAGRGLPAELLGEEAVIGGRRMRGLAAVRRELPALLRRSGLYRWREASVIHGDLCLSNILYDRRTGFVRLIDPRGSFGPLRLFGDPRYDLAKLSHSFLGGYDFLLSGQFDLDCDESGGVRLRIDFEPHHELVRGLFLRWLAARAGQELARVRLVESLLFLSMIPLHSDRPRSQAGFLARGLELLDRAVRALEAGRGGGAGSRREAMALLEGADSARPWQEVP